METQDNITLNKSSTALPYAPYFFYLINKKLKWTNPSRGGRNFLGRICVHHQGGKRLRRYTQVDIYRRVNMMGEVVRIYKVGERSGFVGVILYINGLTSIITIAEEVYVHSVLFSGGYLPSSYIQEKAYGWAVPLKYIRLFTLISNIEPHPYYGGKLATSAGVGGVLSTFNGNDYTVKLSSGWHIRVSSESLAVIGRVSNVQHKYRRLHKAGTSRRLGVRPTVRGVAKNACDHPHGGGEGKGSPPRAQVSPWGKLTKGTPTTNKKHQREKRRVYLKVN